jgi:hypothetical protein
MYLLAFDFNFGYDIKEEVRLPEIITQLNLHMSSDQFYLVEFY